jgi:ribose transport system permease protein
MNNRDAAGRRRIVNLGFERFSGLYLWALFIIVFAIWTPRLFLSAQTAHIIAANNAVPAMIAIAAMIPLICGQFDLSIGSTANLSTIIAVMLQSDAHWNIVAAIAMAVLAGVVIGVINGFFIVVLKVSSFVVTLAMATVVTAIQSIISGSTQPVPPSSSAWTALTQTNFFGYQIVVVYLLVLVLLIWWLLDFTPGGRRLYAIGGNVDAARLAGVKANKWIWLSMIFSSTICAIAGVFYGSQTGPSLTYGSALLLPGFAAIFLGSTQFKPGRYNIWGTLLAVFVLATGVTGLQYVTGAQWLNEMFSGVALLAAVSFAIWRQRRTIIDKRRVRLAGLSALMAGTPPATSPVADGQPGGADQSASPESGVPGERQATP